MKVIGLISGGKDSIYNIMQCVAAGHEIVGLANLEPPANIDELDSYMYQTVGHEGIIQLARSIGLPLVRYVTEGKAKTYEKDYVPSENDEVEDLFKLLQHIRTNIQFDAVAVGAILSDYQRIRVENVCSRLNLITLAYLWRRDQTELLNEMIDSGIKAVLVKVASLGLEPTKHLGVPLTVMRPHLLRMHEKYGLHVCGEGGEYETFTMDCPLFSCTIVVDESETIIHSNDAIAPVGYLHLKKIRLVPKIKTCSGEQIYDLPNRIAAFNVKTPLSFVEDIITDEELKIGVDDNEIENTDVELIKVSHLPNHGRTLGGWLWIGDLVGESDDISIAMTQALDKLQSCLTVAGYQIQDVCAVTMYISDMNQYKALNEIYCKTFKFQNPPTRVCVQCPLNAHTPVLLDALAYSNKICNAQKQLNEEQTDDNNGCSEGDEGATCPLRITMHVQGISHWAPANIGPYSQAVQVGDIIRVAGQIGMVPGTLELIEGGVLKQSRLSLRHVGRIVAALDSNMQIRDVVQGVCYVTNSEYIQIAREEWENRTNNAIVDYVVVSSLPKGAKIEWHLWAHKHNNQFEYQETGECIDNYLLSIRRRFNYENNVAAIVCHIEYYRNRVVETPEQEQKEQHWNILSSKLIIASIEYALKKLNQDYVTTNTSGGDSSPSSSTTRSSTSPLCNLRLFYPINSHVNVMELHEILIENRLKFNIVFTIIPVLQLQSENTLLSICGVRYA